MYLVLALTFLTVPIVYILSIVLWVNLLKDVFTSYEHPFYMAIALFTSFAYIAFGLLLAVSV